ncbi:MAG: Maf family protein [Syntrophales bacterium]|jgi:septum formation protein|nr:Maf family protein [Syntrophales bacterium]MDY0045157.1 Maf family protein [Syntrophales bacterium]
MNEVFVLASASPRRRTLLDELGLKFMVVPSDIEEPEANGGPPHDHALAVSLEKALTVAEHYPDLWVLGADTIVVVDEEILGKPAGLQHAKHMLYKLSGREHRVITGFCIMKKSANTMIREYVESKVLFKNLAEDEITWYSETDEPYDKAGAYAVQGKAAFFIREIHGSHTNVIGLPLTEVVTVLKKVGAIRF